MKEELARRIQDLIRSLGGDDWTAREEAEKDLVQLGVLSIPGLRSALRSGDEEVVTRARHALDEIASR